MDELKRMTIAAARDDRSFYYIIGEGDPIVSAAGVELDVDRVNFESRASLTDSEIAEALACVPKWHGTAGPPRVSGAGQD